MVDQIPVIACLFSSGFARKGKVAIVDHFGRRIERAASLASHSCKRAMSHCPNKENAMGLERSFLQQRIDKSRLLILVM
jgi:hypothetical protein